MTDEDIRPDVLLADYNLPNDMDGLQVAERLRDRLQREIPTIILTGDISAATLRDIARQNCVQINKQVKADYLAQVIRDLLAPVPSRHPTKRRPRVLEMPGGSANPIVYTLDHNSH